MKAILSLAIVAVAIAAPFVIPGLLGVAAGSLAAIAATAAVEVGLSLLSGVIMAPSIPKSLTQTATSRLYATLVTTEPRKTVFGITAGGNDVRYQTYTGSHQEFYHQVICHASHQIQSLDEIWIDNEKAWTAAGGVQGRFVGWLTVQSILLGTSANGIAIDGTWTANCTLTGCAYSYLKFKVMDPANGNNASPFQSGVTNRLTFRMHGAPVYDPRLDSTVTGGSGTQRAGTQSTWAWDDNASRNPALQLLFFLLGWQINGKLALGMGLPPARIDLASFITAANHCDESVALSGGGSEPRYRSDGVISEGDDRSTVIENLCATMHGTLRDNGGKIALQIIVNDLATPTGTLGLGDVLGSEQFDQTQPLNQYFNIVRGRRVDPSDQALYQLTDFPPASLTSPDGIDRIQPVDFPLVQSNGQVQRLAKLRLKRAQYQAKYTANFGSNAWAVSLGGVVQMNHAGMNWTNKLFRIVAQAVSQNGQVKMTLQEESSDVYTWAAEDIAGTAAGTPTAVDPTKLPLAGTLAGKNSVNPGTSDVSAIGSIPPTVPGQSFTYTSTATSVTISWTAMTIYRADGTTISISSGSLAITGLAASTTYKVYPYMADSGGTTGTVSFVTSGTAAGSGSPTACFASGGDAGAAANMSARGNIPLYGFTVTTPASGSAGGGGGGYLCLHPTMMLGDLLADDAVTGALIPAPQGGARITSLKRRLHSQWYVAYSHGEEIARVTPEHRFYRANGKEVRASELKLGDLLSSARDHVEVTGLMLDTQTALLVSIEIPPPHQYYLGPADLLCHNPKP